MTKPAPDHSEPAPPRDPRRLILFGIVSAIVAVLVVWLLYTVRSTLILIYISGLLAMGISPLVRGIERQRAIPIGTRVPRWVAILIIYAGIIGVLVLIGMLVVPPLVEQAEELWRSLPERFAQAQQALACGASTVVVGSAITRPELVTAWFRTALDETIAKAGA